MTTHPSPSPSPARRSRLGLPLIAIVGLALLAAPRAVLHDLGLVSSQTFVNLLLVVVPVLIWITVVLRAQVPNPFVTLLAIGVCYGIALAAIHQLLWSAAFAAPPQLGGNLAGLDPAVQAALLRGAAVVSSLFTGAVVGAVCGLVAWGVGALGRRRPVGTSR